MIKTVVVCNSCHVECGTPYERKYVVVEVTGTDRKDNTYHICEKCWRDKLYSLFKSF